MQAIRPQRSWNHPGWSRKVAGMNELMPHERVTLALNHQETDRPPVDFLATPETWARLKTYLRFEDNEGLLSFLGIDLRQPRQRYIGPPLHRHADGGWTDAWGVRRRPVAYCHGTYNEIAEHPLAGTDDPSQLGKYSWPQPEWWDAECLADEIRRFDAQGSYAIELAEFGDPGGIFETAWYLCGMEQLLVDMIDQPDMAFEIMRRVTDFYLGTLERVMATVGDRIDLIWTSDDIAHQHGILMSIRKWRELVAPHHKRFNQRVHELGARVMYHSCGAVRPFIPDLIGVGVDVLDVLQFSADGMDADEIKANFGKSLCFHGGIDVQTTLPRCSQGEVRRVVRERICVLGRRGGYILAPTHNMQADTPPENVVAMYSEAGSLVS